MNDKKQQLIITALNLFNERGINSVGINEVLAVSGIAKRTLYLHFSGKDELILATLAWRDGIFLRWLAERLSGASSAENVVSFLFQALDDWFRNEVQELRPFNGCFFINTAAEMRSPASPIGQYCHDHKMKVRELLRQHLPDMDEEFIDLLCFLKEGAIVSAYVNQDKEAAKKCLSLALKALNH
ncbi:TetR/AcrR family transcriptional regulator [Pseudenterobacter timonensis]|uniref:TetR/AcrR family transcriptional regulator n=1 Tax=Pseudenterobacter timonensis TaxID=1755099 RepID=A0AAE4IWG3_9ENTR|nr:TetR/AcrR family transcriptional regulator [Pseudenterobacter timonensis]MDR9891612.1 TetR/AcrR family transcriptional regulator [Pseudenterobacter timonensis]